MGIFGSSKRRKYKCKTSGSRKQKFYCGSTHGPKVEQKYENPSYTSKQCDSCKSSEESFLNTKYSRACPECYKKYGRKEKTGFIGSPSEKASWSLCDDCKRSSTSSDTQDDRISGGYHTSVNWGGDY